MSTITVRELPADLQEFLKADALANHRSVNKQVIVALQAYRESRLPVTNRKTSPEQKIAAMQLIRAGVQRELIHDPRTDEEILGYNKSGTFD